MPAATVFVTRINVVAPASAMAAARQASAGPARQQRPRRSRRARTTDGLALVARTPAVLVQLDGVRLAVDVSGEILSRPADLSSAA